MQFTCRCVSCVCAVCATPINALQAGMAHWGKNDKEKGKKNTNPVKLNLHLTARRNHLLSHSVAKGYKIIYSCSVYSIFI